MYRCIFIPQSNFANRRDVRRQKCFLARKCSVFLCSLLPLWQMLHTHCWYIWFIHILYLRWYVMFIHILNLSVLASSITANAVLIYIAYTYSVFIGTYCRHIFYIYMYHMLLDILGRNSLHSGKCCRFICIISYIYM